MKRIYCISIFCMICISSYPQTQKVETIQFLFPEFTQGLILMKGGNSQDVLLNYNSLTEQMIFENEGIKRAIGKNEMELIDSIVIKDRIFIPLNSNFVELIYHSTWDLYVEYKCNLLEKGTPIGYGSRSRTTSIKSYSAFYSEGSSHELILPNGYELESHIHYWLKKNGKLNKFLNIRELKKLYKDKKKLIKEYVKKHDVKYDNKESIIQLIKHLESI